MKKLIALMLLLVSIVCCFAACDHGENAETAPRKTKTKEIEEPFSGKIEKFDGQEYTLDMIGIGFDEKNESGWTVANKVEENEAEEIVFVAEKEAGNPNGNNVKIGVYETEMSPEEILEELKNKVEEENKQTAQPEGKSEVVVSEDIKELENNPHGAYYMVLENKIQKGEEVSVDAVKKVITYQKKIGEEKVVVLITIKADKKDKIGTIEGWINYSAEEQAEKDKEKDAAETDEAEAELQK